MVGLNRLVSVMLKVFIMIGCVVSGVVIAESSDNDVNLEYEKEYIIGVDDTIRVSVWRNEDLSISVPVRPDGKITTPLVGDVMAAGKTPMVLAEDIKSLLGVYIRDPQVTVVLTGLSSHEYISRVRVTGAVRSPTTIPFRRGMTVLDLILVAGGVNQFASANKTKLYRQQNDGTNKVLKVKLNDILKKGKLGTNYKIVPGDILTVPERLF